MEAKGEGRERGRGREGEGKGRGVAAPSPLSQISGSAPGTPCFVLRAPSPIDTAIYSLTFLSQITTDMLSSKLSMCVCRVIIELQTMWLRNTLSVSSVQWRSQHNSNSSSDSFHKSRKTTSATSLRRVWGVSAYLHPGYTKTFRCAPKLRSAGVVPEHRFTTLPDLTIRFER